MRRVLVLTALLLCTKNAQANPLDAYGFGSHAQGLAGAFAARADDGSANYYNPAGLARGHDLQIDIGYAYADPLLRIDRRNVGQRSSHGFEVALAAPGKIGPVRFAFGVLVWLPDQQLTEVSSLPFAQPRFVYYGSRVQRLVMQSNIAIQILPGLYIGGGLTFMSRTSGAVNLQGAISIGDPNLSDLSTSINVDLVAVRYPQFGIAWDITRWLSVAATYRDKFGLKVDQQFQIDGNIGLGKNPIVANGYFYVRTVSEDLFQPWQLTGAAAMHLRRDLWVSFDLTFARWSDFPVPASQLIFNLNLKQYQSLVMLPPQRSYPASQFHDIAIPRLGVEWRAADREHAAVDLRFGYAYEPSPVPDQIGESTLVDNNKHTFSVGAGIELRKISRILRRPLSLDAHLACTYLAERLMPKLDPRNPIGDVASDGVVLNMGLTLRSQF